MGLCGLVERAPLEWLDDCNIKGGQNRNSAVNGKQRFVYLYRLSIEQVGTTSFDKEQGHELVVEFEKKVVKVTKH